MESVSLKDREILRELAARKAAFAHSARNDEILKMWDAQARGVRDTPTVRLLFSNFTREVIAPRLRCEGSDARKLESALLSKMVGRELFDDDTPMSDTFDVPLRVGVAPFGLAPKKTRIEGQKTSGYHIDPVIEDFDMISTEQKQSSRMYYMNFTDRENRNLSIRNAAENTAFDGFPGFL